VANRKSETSQISVKKLKISVSVSKKDIDRSLVNSIRSYFTYFERDLMNAAFTHAGWTTRNRTENFYKSVLVLSSSSNI